MRKREKCDERDFRSGNIREDTIFEEIKGSDKRRRKLLEMRDKREMKLMEREYKRDDNKKI